MLENTGSINEGSVHKDPNMQQFESIGQPVAHGQAQAVHQEHANLVSEVLGELDGDVDENELAGVRKDSPAK
jgi:xanthosine utilization system XapX-like protein